MSPLLDSYRPSVTPSSGRPKSLDPEAKKCICALVAQGFSLKQAATYVACHRETIRNERRRDPHFDANLRRALEMADIQPLDLIHRTAKTSWRAAAWLVEFRRRVKKEDREARDARKQKAASANTDAIARSEKDGPTFSPSPPDSIEDAPIAVAENGAESVFGGQLASQPSRGEELRLFGVEAEKFDHEPDIAALLTTSPSQPTSLA